MTRAGYEDYGFSVDMQGSEEQQVSCPQCSKSRKKKNTKCLSVNVKKECWLCHHCGWVGSLSKGGHYSDPHYRKPDYQKPRILPTNAKIIPQVMAWMNSRSISNETLLRNRITVNTVYMPQLEAMVKALGFPYFRDGEHINTKWRDKKKNFRLEAGAELILYGIDDIKDADTVIFVEGEMDKLSVEEAGYLNCVSLPNGAPAPNSKRYAAHFDYLVSAESLLEGKTFILFTDADDAGKLAETELARRLGRERCSRVCLPDGFKDANEYLMAHGREALKEVIDNAKPFPVAGIHTANSLIGDVRRLHQKGLSGGEKTGWVAVDYYYTVKAGEMTIVTGIPNHGKSNFLDCLTINIAKQSGWRFAVFSPENQPLERHAAGYVEKYNNKPFNDITDEYIDATMNWLNDHYYWILPDETDDWTIDNILDKAKSLVYRFGVNGMIIDPYNEIEHRRKAAQSETEYISEFLSKVRNFARLHNIHIWIVAHPSKMRKNEKDGMYPPPTPYDISGSAHWRNKADNCLTVHRDMSVTGSRKVMLLIQKIRFAEVGRVGSANLIYDPDQCNYREESHFDD